MVRFWKLRAISLAYGLVLAFAPTHAAACVFEPIALARKANAPAVTAETNARTWHRAAEWQRRDAAKKDFDQVAKAVEEWAAANPAQQAKASQKLDEVIAEVAERQLVRGLLLDRSEPVSDTDAIAEAKKELASMSTEDREALLLRTRILEGWHLDAGLNHQAILEPRLRLRYEALRQDIDAPLPANFPTALRAKEKAMRWALNERLLDLQIVQEKRAALQVIESAFETRAPTTSSVDSIAAEARIAENQETVALLEQRFRAEEKQLDTSPDALEGDAVAKRLLLLHAIVAEVHKRAIDVAGLPVSRKSQANLKLLKETSDNLEQALLDLTERFRHLPGAPGNLLREGTEELVKNHERDFLDVEKAERRAADHYLDSFAFRNEGEERVYLIDERELDARYRALLTARAHTAAARHRIGTSKKLLDRLRGWTQPMQRAVNDSALEKKLQSHLGKEIAQAYDHEAQALGPVRWSAQDVREELHRRLTQELASSGFANPTERELSAIRARIAEKYFDEHRVLQQAARARFDAVVGFTGFAERLYEAQKARAFSHVHKLEKKRRENHNLSTLLPEMIAAAQEALEYRGAPFEIEQAKKQVQLRMIPSDRFPGVNTQAFAQGNRWKADLVFAMESNAELNANGSYHQGETRLPFIEAANQAAATSSHTVIHEFGHFHWMDRALAENLRTGAPPPTILGAARKAKEAPALSSAIGSGAYGNFMHLTELETFWLASRWKARKLREEILEPTKALAEMVELRLQLQGGEAAADHAYHLARKARIAIENGANVQFQKEKVDFIADPLLEARLAREGKIVEMLEGRVLIDGGPGYIDIPLAFRETKPGEPWTHQIADSRKEVISRLVELEAHAKARSIQLAKAYFRVFQTERAKSRQTPEELIRTVREVEAILASHEAFPTPKAPPVPPSSP